MAGQVDFHQHMQNQLSFLRASCESFDRGAIGEGARIAAVLRVLLADGSRSMTSLLTHLGVKGTVQLLTTCPPRENFPPPGMIMYEGLLGMTKYGFGAKLDAGSWSSFVGVDKWWNQVVLVESAARFSRGLLVRTAADQDGGAHIDAKLTPDYERLKAGLWTLVGQTGEGAEQRIRVTDHQFHTLRQMGYEVLNSPDLSVLTAPPSSLGAK